MATNFENVYLSIIDEENEIIEENKIFNSILAAGMLFTSALLPSISNAQEKEIAKNSIVQAENIINISVTTEEATIIRYLYTLLKINCQNYEKKDLIKELSYICQIFATNAIQYNKKVCDYLVESKVCVLSTTSNISFNKSDFLMRICINYGKQLVNNPESLKFKNNLIMIFRRIGDDDPKNTDKFEYELKNQTSAFKYYVIKKNNNLTPQENFLAKVLYSETSSVCNEKELKLICKVIMNRIGNKNFGNAKNAYEVVKVKNAFSAVQNHNTPWNDFNKLSNDPNVKRAKKYAKAMMENRVADLNLIGRR